MRALSWIPTSTQDLWYAARCLRKNPGFLLVAVLFVALGNGTNTTIFHVTDPLLFEWISFFRTGLKNLDLSCGF